MVFSVLYGLGLVDDGQPLGSGLTISEVTGGTVDVEVGRLVDKRSSSRIGTGVRGGPEERTEVDPPIVGGTWRREFSVTERCRTTEIYTH